jgi:CRISPR-associated protein Cmr3
MIIKIDALDTLFFRDGKPFTMGEDTWANGIFPPYPSVIYGALRSAYFSHHLNELKKANNEDDPTRDLKIKGFYILADNNVYLPLPNDCVKKKGSRDNLVFVLPVHKLIDIKSSCPTQQALKSEKEVVENVDGELISIDSFKEYLKCAKDSFSSILKVADRVLPEPKIGIGINRESGTSEEGKLYRVDMRRLENKRGESLSVIIDFEGLNLPERGMMRLGGEGKAVSYQQFEPIDFSIDNFNFDGNKFKLYLSTPAIFENGWLPAWIDEKNLICEGKGLKLKLLTVSIGKPVYIGGFNMKTRKPKPMCKAVPAGSVYYFEVIEGDIQKAFEIFNQSPISDFYPKQGFGIAYVGGTKNV